MKVKNIIVKLTIILPLFLILSCQNKNSELEKKVEKLEKENAEILKKQKEQQNAQENTVNIKKEEKTLQPKIKDYEATRDKVSEEYGWSVEETQANEKLDDELTKVYNLIRERMSESRKIEFRNEQRQWIKNRKKKVENSNNGEDGNPGMGGRAGANVEILTYQELTKDRLIKFARMYDNME